MPGGLCVISQSHVRLSSPHWNCLKSLASILSKLSLGVLPEKTEKGSLKPRSRADLCREKCSWSSSDFLDS